MTIRFRSDDIHVIEGSIGWNDIGRWDALVDIFTADENGNIDSEDRPTAVDIMKKIKMKVYL